MNVAPVTSMARLAVAWPRIPDRTLNRGLGRIPATAPAPWPRAPSPWYHRIMRTTKLPAEDLIDTGLRDLRRGNRTEAALLVSVGASRLRQLGYSVPNAFLDPEESLYALLAEVDPPSARSRYNALVRRLVSFERAAACVS